MIWKEKWGKGHFLEVFECCKIMYDRRDSSSPGEFVFYQGGINAGKLNLDSPTLLLQPFHWICKHLIPYNKCLPVLSIYNGFCLLHGKLTDQFGSSNQNCKGISFWPSLGIYPIDMLVYEGNEFVQDFPMHYL